MLDQPRNCPAQVHREKLDIELGKCHFMVNQGIVLGHIISEKGIEVDKVKIDFFSKLPSPTNVKTVRQFLGHAGFYRRFIMDISNKFPRLFTNCWKKIPNSFGMQTTKRALRSSRLI